MGQRGSLSEPYYYHSAGFDLLFEFNLFRVPFPLTGGARFVYLFNENDIRLYPIILGVVLAFY
jgi:hypothetical protein